MDLGPSEHIWAILSLFRSCGLGFGPVMWGLGLFGHVLGGLGLDYGVPGMDLSHLGPALIWAIFMGLGLDLGHFGGLGMVFAILAWGGGSWTK